MDNHTKKIRRIVFAAGPGNVIESHRHWRRGNRDPSLMCETFSAEFEAFCEDRGLDAYLIAPFSPPDLLVEGRFKIEHRPKSGASGIFHHVKEIRFGLGLLVSAIRFRADYFVLQSGATHYFVLPLFALFSIKVIPVLHNTLWPAGFRPRSLVKKLILWADSIFFRSFADSIICVSSECCRQISEVTGRADRIWIMQPRFHRGLFDLTPAPNHCLPFRLMYAGRITRSKGVFDLLQIVKEIDRRRPGAVQLTICGTGPDFEELQRESEKLQLADLVGIKGRVEPEHLRQLLIESHAAIIPTRSDFAEGLAMSAIEPVLLGRPIITSAVVPALESLQDAAIIARTDDVSSYVDGVFTIVESPETYRRLVGACAVLREQFFGPGKSFQDVLGKVIPN